MRPSRLTGDAPCSSYTAAGGLHLNTLEPLQFQLDEITAHTRALVPPECLKKTQDLVDELHRSGLASGIVQTGTRVSDFQLPSAQGKTVRLADLLTLGPVVLKFFRGRWDPYDITELEFWEQLQPRLRAAKSILIGISPQTPRQNAFTAEQHRLTFPLLSDKRCLYAHSLHLAYTVDAATQQHYRSMLVNIPFLNGDDTWQLPLPATVVLAAGSGQVLYAEARADHRERPDPDAALRAIPA